MAFALTALLVVAAVLVDLVQVRQAQVRTDAAVELAAVDGARVALRGSTLPPRRCLRPPCPRVLGLAGGSRTEALVRARLAENLQSVAYLMNGTTPDAIAQSAEMAMINPRPGVCTPSPYAESGSDGHCYYDPFIAVRVTIPMRALWGSVGFSYRVAVVGSTTDNDVDQRPATPIPTSTPGKVATFAVPKPTCGTTC